MSQSFDFRGPLAALEPEQSSTAIKCYYYPADLTTVTGHYVRFDCQIFEDSRFQQGIKGNFGSAKDAGSLLTNNAEAAALKILSGASGTSTGAAASTLGQFIKPISTGGSTTTAALNYLNALPEGGDLYKYFPGLRGLGNKRTLNHIYMYTPDTLVYGYNNQWETVSLREKFGVLADGVSAFQDIKKGDFGSAAALLTPYLSKGLGLGDATSQRNTLMAMMGFPINPVNEVLFKETQQRQFTMRFKLYPQTAKETEEIFNIVEQFAFHAAPEYAQGEFGGFLIMPSVFDIKFMFVVRNPDGSPMEIENPWIRRISTCALTDFNVDYSNDGAWQAMEDGSPRSVDLTLSFKELEIIDKSRVKRGF
jgi:hypothetical protein